MHTIWLPVGVLLFIREKDFQSDTISPWPCLSVSKLLDLSCPCDVLISKMQFLYPCGGINNGVTMGTCTSETEGGMVWSITFFFFLHGMDVACTLLTWGTPSTRLLYVKRDNRWRLFDALGDVLLGNCGSSCPCGCYFNTHCLPKHCSRKCTHPSTEMAFPDGCVLF